MWLGIPEEKDFGLLMPCMAIFLLLWENKIRFHNKICSKTTKYF
jgi:hypothetical protein